MTPDHSTRREFLIQSAAGAAVLSAAPYGLSASSKAVPGPRTEVRMRDGRPMFFLDDQPYAKPVF